MNERLDDARERLNYDSAHALFERNCRLLNEHDARHIPTIFTEDIEFKDDAGPCCSGRDQRALGRLGVRSDRGRVQPGASPAAD